MGEKLKLHGATVSAKAFSFQGASIKGVIAATVAIAICSWADINVINEIIKNADKTVPKNLPDWLRKVMAGLFIAGGSQRSVKLFQDVLGFSKDNRNLISKEREEEGRTAEDKSKRDRVAADLERKRLEAALVAADNEEKLASFRADTDAKLAEIERRKRLRDAEKRAGDLVDPRLPSSPADAYLKDVMDNWEEFVALRAEMRSEVADGSAYTNLGDEL